MPLIVRELVIRATLAPPKKEGDSTAPSKAGKSQEAIVKQCVEQVMSLLEEKEAR